MNFWTALVIVGVAIELGVIVKEYRDDRHEWSRGIIRPPDKPSRWLLFWNLSGTALVVIGITSRGNALKGGGLHRRVIGVGVPEDFPIEIAIGKKP